jgi:hypothetical protein
MEILQEDKNEQIKSALKAVFDFVKSNPVVLIALGGLIMVAGVAITILTKKKSAPKL